MSKNIEIKKVNLNELLTEIDGSYIPYYQREYNWGKKEIERLIYDLEHNNSDEYFCGNIILHKNDLNYQAIVDGQQRISTILLITKYFQNINLLNFDNTNLYNVSNYEIKSENLRDKAKLQRILSMDKEEIQNQNWSSSENLENKYAQNYRIIKSIFSQKNNEEIIKIKQRFSNIVFALIKVNNEYDEYRLFTNINSTGLPLNAYDLIKNFMLSKIKPTNDKLKIYLWKLEQITGFLDDKNKEDNLNKLIKSFNTYKTGKVENEEPSMLFRQFETIYDEQYLKNNLDMLNLFDDFIKFGAFYKFIQSSTILNYSFAKPYRIISLNEQTFLVLVIDILEKYSKLNIEENINIWIEPIDKQQIYNAFLVIEAYILFRELSGYRVNDLSRYIPIISTKIKKSSNDLTYAANLMNILYFEKKNECTNVKMPSKERFFNNLANSNIYIKNTKLVKALLTRIDEFINPHNKWVQSKLEVEHIMPQDLQKWNNITSNYDKNVIDHYLNTIGNLTIVNKELNKDLSNESFDVKKSKLIAKDEYSINDYIKQQDNWDIESIKNRTYMLIKNYLENIFDFSFIYEELDVEAEKIDFEQIVYGGSFVMWERDPEKDSRNLTTLKSWNNKQKITYEIMKYVIIQYCHENNSVQKISTSINPKDIGGWTAYTILYFLNIDTSRGSSYRNLTMEECNKLISEKEDQMYSLYYALNENN